MTQTMAHPLSHRQLDIVKLAAEGLTVGRIGSVLGLSPNTIKSHLESARARVHASNTVELVAISVRMGWI